MRIAVKKPVGARRIDRDACENSGRERAPDSTDRVHAHHVERVVVAETALSSAPRQNIALLQPGR